MAQVKTIKKEEKCLTTPPPAHPMLTLRPSKNEGAKGRRKVCSDRVDTVTVERDQVDIDY